MFPAGPCRPRRRPAHEHAGALGTRNRDPRETRPLLAGGRARRPGVGRRRRAEQAREFLARQSIEAQADAIEVPTLFLTSRGDDQVPHALVEPMIEKMQAAGKDVEVYTAEKSPHAKTRDISAPEEMRAFLEDKAR